MKKYSEALQAFEKAHELDETNSVSTTKPKNSEVLYSTLFRDANPPYFVNIFVPS